MLSFYKLSSYKKSNLINCVLSVKRLKMDNASILKSIKLCIPPLSAEKHKGQAGRIGIVGGSLEYTGAPYFAGITALKVGADLVHVFCASSAATVIKSYSPELIVHPLLDQPNAAQEISPWLDRLHALVIGPGLGRNTSIYNVVSDIINLSREKRIPLVIDADGLFLLTESLELIKDYPSPGVILTPNNIEFERLYAKIKDTKEKEEYKKIDFSKLGDNITILKKGHCDEVFNRCEFLQWQSNVGGSNRRCGGQGDLLSGSLATFFYWALSNIDRTPIANTSDKNAVAASISCYAASRLVRLCNEKAFVKNGRSMLASDMVEQVHSSFETLFEQ